jgi:Holliday junction DNA helicase RuvA
MIRLVKGKICSLTQGGVVILVGGLGYQVTVNKKLNLLPEDNLTLHTYLAVRETALDLYGFVTEHELTMFELLLTIPKFGPYSDWHILDQSAPDLLIESIELQDPAHLAKLSSITKKTAEKIVLALKDKIDHFAPLGTFSKDSTSSTYQDAFDTLITLGYNPINIKQVLDTLSSTDTTSQLVKDALRSLA